VGSCNPRWSNCNATGCAAWQATSDSDWLTITNGLDTDIGPIAYTVANNPTNQNRTGVLSIGASTFTVIKGPSPVAITQPQAGPTLTCSANRFSWTTSGVSAFRYTLSTSPGAADIAAGVTGAGSVIINGVRLNGNPV
jgi:hypothetical protein